MADLAARHRRLAQASEAAVLRVLRSGRWVGGPEVQACESEAAGLFGRGIGVGVNSGTDALILALQALGVGPGDEVLVPALSFFATAGAVARIAARPVVVDVLEDAPLMDPDAAQAAMGPRTRAAIPVHLFGMACPHPGLDVPLVEDSAQAVGLDPAPRLGQFSAVSFYPTKTIGAAGDAGLLACDDPQLAERARTLANHGAVAGQPHLHRRAAGQVGGNSRLDPLQAALIRVQLADLPRRVARRRGLRPGPAPGRAARAAGSGRSHPPLPAAQRAPGRAGRLARRKGHRHRHLLPAPPLGPARCAAAATHTPRRGLVPLLPFPALSRRARRSSAGTSAGRPEVLLTMSAWIVLQIFALLLGLCLGSFLNVCIARMPEDRSVVSPPSHCPSCGAQIRWYDNIPVLSWALLRARCRTCATSISATYPLVEACTGLLILLTWRQVFSGPGDLDLAHVACFIYYAAFVCMLVGLTFIDLRHYIIPDEFSIYAVPLGVLGAWGLGLLQAELAPSWQQSLIGALAGAGFLLAIAGVYWLVRREEGMGFGDVKLLAMIGSFLGAFPALFLVVLLASVLGSAVGITHTITQGRGLRTAIPFGPFLALGALVAFFFGDVLTRSLLLGLPLLLG